MSAILSADDLNDFISPGVACIKPVETLPSQPDHNPYEVTTEDKVQAQNPAPASISLTDCLACSGCVTSAEAVLVSLQSHTEVLHTLDTYPALSLDRPSVVSVTDTQYGASQDAKIFVASVSPQVRASIAATFGTSEKRAGNLIEQFLSGSQGLRIGGKHNNGFHYVIDTNRMREACLVLGADEVTASVADKMKPRPILTSACPGWICYAEKTHPHVLPHLSTLKSPQALTGTLVKSVLSKKLNIHPSQIWHLAIMPCFDKKLEASREELTDRSWSDKDGTTVPVRDVDCVITSRELLTLASARNIQLASLPQTPLPTSERTVFPDSIISKFLFSRQSSSSSNSSPEAGSSGGYLHHILLTNQASHPGSQITTIRGRNTDVIEYTLAHPASANPILKCARYYGFKNIQNLVRKLNPARQSRLPGATARRAPTAQSSTLGRDYAYVEVMACPGGCTNGGGQIKIDDVADTIPQTRGEEVSPPSKINSPQSQKEWLARVDEAYFSADSSSQSSDEDDDEQRQGDLTVSQSNPDQETMNGISAPQIRTLLSHWSELTSIPLSTLAYTTYRKVESDVGKKSVAKKMGDGERIAAIAGLQGGGW